MKRKCAIVAAAMCILSPAAGAADATWSVNEGGASQLRGTWHLMFQGDRIAGHAEMAGRNGQKVTYHINGEKVGGEFRLQRGNPSDRIACAYRGKPDGQGKIGGAALCGAAASTWVATKR